MKKSGLFITIFLIFLTGFLAHTLLLKKTVYGDGIFYYSWLRSLVVDGDINFSDEYRHYGILSPVSPTGLPANKFAVGPAVFWAPAYVFTHFIVKGDGYGLPYQFAAGFSGMIGAVLGLIFVYLAVTKKFGNGAGIFAVCCTAFATNLLYYGSLDTVNSHAASFLAAALLIYNLLTDKPNWWLCGIMLGLICSVRFQDALYSIILIPFINRKTLLPIIGGFLAAFLPQMLAWKSLYGSWLFNTYQFEGETFDFFHPQILQVLISPSVGLFSRTPILIVSLIGMVYGLKHISFKILIPVILIVTEIYLVSSWKIWWQGASYGGRMFISLLPVFALGLGLFYKSISRNIRLTKFIENFLLPALIIINFGEIGYFLISN